MIYFDNAATTQMSDVALDALIEVSRNNFGNPSSLYNAGRKARGILEESRRIIADCIGALPEEIFFTSCGTESDNWAISQCINQKAERVISSQVEHHAVLNAIEKYRCDDSEIILLPVDSGCNIDKNVLIKSLDGRKTFVSIMFQNNETGVIQPIKEMAQIVHNDNPNSIFHTDAVQAVGHTKMDVNELGIDMMSASAHKFNGPKGIGFLFVSKKISLVPLIAGGGQERGLRSGTENVAAIYSMAKALHDNITNLNENANRIKSLEARLLNELYRNGIKYSINGDINKKAAGVLNIAFDDLDAEGLLNVLDTKGICISTGSACNSKSKMRSYVLTSMGLDIERIDSSVRISIGWNNNEDEIDLLADSISQYINIINSFTL